MSVMAALYEHLTADTDVTAEVGTRIYPLQAPETATLPYITYQKISTAHMHHFGAAAAIVTSAVQIDVWGNTSVEVEDAVKDVRESLDGRLHFSMGATEALAVKGIFLNGTSDGLVEPTDGTDKGTFRTTMTFDIWHAETVPTFA